MSAPFWLKGPRDPEASRLDARRCRAVYPGIGRCVLAPHPGPEHLAALKEGARAVGLPAPAFLLEPLPRVSP